MNDKYITIDGKSYICDDDGNQTSTDYYDNLDEVLVHENVIEDIEKNIEYLESSLNKYQTTKKDTIFSVLKSLLIGCTFFSIIFLFLYLTINSGDPTIFSIFDGSRSYSFQELIKMPEMWGAVNTFYIPSISILLACDHVKYQLTKKEKNGINSELEFLKSQLEQEKAILKGLHENKTNSKTNAEFRFIQVDSSKKIDSINDRALLSYDLGANEKKYRRYYYQGNLDEKLGHDEASIQLAEDFLENKGYARIKKKKE